MQKNNIKPSLKPTLLLAVTLFSYKITFGMEPLPQNNTNQLTESKFLKIPPHTQKNAPEDTAFVTFYIDDLKKNAKKNHHNKRYEKKLVTTHIEGYKKKIKIILKTKRPYVDTLEYKTIFGLSLAIKDLLKNHVIIDIVLDEAIFIEENTRTFFEHLKKAVTQKN